MRERVRLAVAGTGAFGCEHLRRVVAMADVELCAVADIDLATARRAAEQFGAPPIYAEAQDLLAHARPDGLIVATPGPTHLPIALAALTLDIPVLVEKPVGMSTAEAGALAAAEATSGGFVLPGHILRFSAQHRQLREIARSAAIGPILAFHSRRHRDDSHASRYPNVDPVLMTMIHDIDLGLWLTGGKVESVLAARRPARSRRSDTIVMASCGDGPVWQISSAWIFPGQHPPPDRVEIVGEQGSVELEVGASLRRFGAQAHSVDRSEWPPEDALAVELRCFVDCIRLGRRPEIVTMRDACAGLAIADAVLASLASGAVEPVR